MAKKGLIPAALVLMTALGFVVLWDRSERSVRESRPFVQVRQAGGALPAPTVILESSAPASGLSHGVPPDPASLRDAPHRQSIYDAEAKPGSFVTPPNVSIEH